MTTDNDAKMLHSKINRPFGWIYFIQKITDNSDEITHPAFFAAKNYAVSIPKTTSGWYLPSMGQLALVINNLGVTDDSKKFTAQNCSDKASDAKFDETGEDAPSAIKGWMIFSRKLVVV